MAFQSTPLMRGETSGSIIGVSLRTTFQSTPLMRGETNAMRMSLRGPAISIHSPHARGDLTSACCSMHRLNFNPLPSCEGRRVSSTEREVISYFNPLPSCEGRRNGISTFSAGSSISIHSPHARGDPANGVTYACELISIHSPHARGDVGGY